PATPQRGGYLIDANGASVTQLFAPGFGLFDLGERGGVVYFYRAACSIVADLGRENFWDVSWDVTGQDLVTPKLHHYSADLGESSLEFGVPYTPDLLARLIPDGDGLFAFLHVVDGTDTPLSATGLYKLDGATASLLEPIELPNDLGFSPAFAADVGAIFYIGQDSAFPDENAMFALYRYDLETGVAELVEDIGSRTSLKVWEGAYAKGTPMVAANADGSVVAYRWANGAADEGGVQMRVASRNTQTGDYEFGFASCLSGISQTLLVDETEGRGTNALDCQYPAVSADGRFVAFTARATNAPGNANIRQAWRYDQQENRLENLSEGLNSDCHAIALSPSGRHAAFVAADSATELPQLFRVDCGPAVTLATRQLVLPPGETVKLDLAVAAGKNATIEVSGTIPGTLKTIDDDILAANTPYAVETLPWQITTSGQVGSTTLTFKVTEGTMTAMAELSITVSNFTNLTNSVLPKSIRDDYEYTHLGFSADGRQALVLTNASLVSRDSDKVPTQDVYRLYLSGGRLELLTGDAAFSSNVYAPRLSGDARTVYWIDQSGTLRTDAGLSLATGVSQLAPAVSNDGQVVVIRKGNSLWKSTDAGVSWTQLQVEGLPEAAVYSTPMLSNDGGVLAFTVRTGGVLALYVLDGAGVCQMLAPEISALEGLTQDGERVLVRRVDGSFAWFSVGNAKATKISLLPPKAREVSLAGNGRFVAYVAPSSEDATLSGVYLLDLRKGITTEITAGADGSSFSPVLAASGRLLLFSSDATNLIDGLEDVNEERDLFLYTNPNWTNSLPGFTGTKIDKDIYEDPDNAFALNLYLRDNDDDALVPSLGVVATLGTARLVPPCEGQFDYRLSYLPPQDFCGTDSVQIRAWDGTGWSAWNTLQLVVQNVNDEPIWDVDTPAAVEVMAGAGLQVSLHATDADESNPEPDVLRYSLEGEVPSWVVFDSSSGRLTLRPGFGDDGEYTLTAMVTDGTVSAEHKIIVTVTPLAECEVPLTTLHTAGAGLPADLDPGSALGRWVATFAGCWVSFGNGWQPLSLPGDIDVEILCAALGCEKIWLYSTERYLPISHGKLPAGTGFWAKVTWPARSSSVSLWLKPVLTRSGELPRFCGPLVGEEPPVGLRGVEKRAWVNSSDWQLGRGYFQH
ncbi:MAG: hypothetical protein IKR13_03910, partial [Victivallales bacterium]|nr:hypothetical protein [Victivallales bacterium]